MEKFIAAGYIIWRETVREQERDVNYREGEGFIFSPIGFIRTGARYRYEAPRQAVYASSCARLELNPVPELAVAAADLEGFDRIWIVSVFHLNLDHAWKPKVQPPVSPDGKRYGVLATRSPHRPNPIGLSCVELREVRDRTLYLGPTDLLDGTPVLDVKPYVPAADSFPHSAAGWRDQVPESAPWQIVFTPQVRERMAWILAHSGLDLENFCRVQLAVSPLDAKRHRLTELPNAPGTYAVGCRTWQIYFTVEESSRTVSVCGVAGHYAESELAPGAPDRYGDKELHREFRRQFGS